MHTNSAHSHSFRENFAYTTRWRFDLRTPPLRIAIASPVESTSVREWENIKNTRTEIADGVPGDWLIQLAVNRYTQQGLGKITLTYCHSVVPGTIT